MIKLTGVSETLLITFYARCLESQRVDSIIKDPKSLEILQNIDFDFTKFSDIGITQVVVAIRTEILDRETKAFLEKNPNAIIINLGAGLCTRFFRVDNGQLNWFELDMEEVKPVWEKLIGETERHKYLAYSVLDFSWMDFFSDKKDENFLFIVEGLFQYFEEKNVKQIILEIKKKFPRAELLVETISPLAIAMNKKIHANISNNASYKWGIPNLKQIEGWSNGIKLVEVFYYLDRYNSRWGWRKFFKYIPFLKNLIRIAHIKFE